MHSLTGASSAERWMNCSGYLHLAQQMGAPDPNRLDPDYTREGTAAHTIAARCLTTGRDAWEFTGEKLEGVVIGEGEDQVPPSAIQEYVNECRRVLDVDPANTQHWIETAVGADESKRPHAGFYGTLDFGALISCQDGDILTVLDLKFGEGVYVEVKDNEQEMYYAYGLLRKLLYEHGIELPLNTVIRLGIVQPRFWDYQGPRYWETTVEKIWQWGTETLIPMMKKRSAVTEADATYVPGDWCRFCPVKLRCPAMRGMFGAAVKAATGQHDPKSHTDAELGREYGQVPMVEMYLKSLKGEVDYRANNGREDTNWKLVKKKMDRVWKGGALPKLRESLGDLAMTPPTLKSPAQMEKVSDQAKQLTAQWTYTPDGGTVAAHTTDRRLSQKATTIGEVFEDFEGRHFP